MFERADEIEAHGDERAEVQAAPGSASHRMSRQRARDTKPELALRRELHRRGLRYFVNRRVLTQVRREADVVFPRQRVAVFVDGCFWHSCPLHATQAKSNAAFWEEKLAANVARDRDTDRRLLGAGWAVVRVWEHEDALVSADRVEAAVRDLLG